MVRSKLFHLGDVITVATLHMTSPRYLDGVYDILDFMTGERIAYHQIPRCMIECQHSILRQYPQFSGPAFARAMAALDTIVSSRVDVKDRVCEWLLAIMAGQYGVGALPLRGPARDMLAVVPLTLDEHERIDPESEWLEVKAMVRAV